MDRKTKNFYVKRMQKYIIVICGIMMFAVNTWGCARKDEDALMLLQPAESVIESTAGELPEIHMESQTGMETLSDDVDTMGREVVADIGPVMVWIHICGAVNNPGVYELPEGSRIYEAVDLAGGFAEDACEDYVNLAQVITDASRIMIPTTDEVAEGSIFLQDTTAVAINDNGLVNINTADAEELCTLPGIGESRAEAIISYRNKTGGFDTIEQIMEVEGIKSGMYSKIQDKICVR